MANLKSITELPVATSADGVNLIVNDNGSAKQIAAGAVGAQADWNVKDENHPAFVKNKPFYDTREYDTKTITFDGDMTGKETQFASFTGNYAVKISDQFIPKDKIIGATMTVKNHVSGESYTQTITEDLIWDNGSMIYCSSIDSPISYGRDIVMDVYKEFVYGELTFTPGVWIWYIFDSGDPYYASEISWSDFIGGELKQIELKYIPEPEYDFDCVATLLSIDENGNQNWDYNIKNQSSFNDILTKIQSGISPKGKIVIDTVTHADETGVEYPAIEIIDTSSTWLYEHAYGEIYWGLGTKSGISYSICFAEDGVYTYLRLQ